MNSLRKNTWLSHIFTVVVILGFLWLRSSHYEEQTMTEGTWTNVRIVPESRCQKASLDKPLVERFQQLTNKMRQSIEQALQSSKSRKAVTKIVGALRANSDTMEVLGIVNTGNFVVGSVLNVSDSSKYDKWYVCPWKRTQVDLNCHERIVPIQDSISIWLDFTGKDNLDPHKIFSSFSVANYANICLLITTTKTTVSTLKNVVKFLKLACVEFIEVPESFSYIQLVSVVLKHAKKFIIVGRDLELFDDHLEVAQLLQMATQFKIDVVGGSHRNSSGHWVPGCYQTKLHNFTFKAVAESGLPITNCTQCDHLTSPFLIDSSKFKNIIENIEKMRGSLDLKKMSENSFYTNFFLFLSSDGFRVVSCPDVMFHTKSIQFEGDIMTKQNWQPVAKIWSLSRILKLDGSAIEFECDEVSIKCLKEPGLMVPICCWKILVSQLLHATNRFTELSLDYILIVGTLIGALKMETTLPWDIDHDIHVRCKSMTILAQYEKSRIRKSNVAFSCASSARKYCFYSTKQWQLEMWCRSYDLSPTFTWDKDFPNRNMKPTKILMHGRWLLTFPNPALNIRNRYAWNYLRHVEHHSKLKGPKTHSLDQMLYYHKYGGKWSECPKPGFHGCLDRLLLDGNVQFKNIFI